MKIRSGFVSNSSSSSFICNRFVGENGEYAIPFDEKEIERKLQVIFKFCFESGILNAKRWEECHGAKPTYSAMFGRIAKLGKSDFIKFKKEWFEDDDYLKWNKYMFVIDSAGDNSIPYEVFEVIKGLFNAERIHLG
jgi:hypothetical protein